VFAFLFFLANIFGGWINDEALVSQTSSCVCHNLKYTRPISII
jgi:hypothetical protein